MSKLLLIGLIVLIAGCESPAIDVEDCKTPEEEKQDLLREQYPDYDYYLDLYRDGVWELVKTSDSGIEHGGIDWAERCLRNPENTHGIPDGAPYKFNNTTGLSFIK